MNSFNERYISFSKPFIDGLNNVYSTMLSTDLTAGKPTLKKDHVPLGNVTSIMSMNGILKNGQEEKHFNGSFIISWTKESFLKSASAMMGEDYTEITEEIEDVAGEITNITMGNAKKVLAEEGYAIEMSIPTIILGEGRKIPAKDKNVISVTIPFDSPLGKVFMEINYLEG